MLVKTPWDEINGKTIYTLYLASDKDGWITGATYAIDGASYWQMQRSITLPLLGPTIRIWAFLSIIGALQLFDLVYIIWGQYVSATAGTSTMATYMVLNGRLAGNYGYGNAVAVVLFLISLVVALIYQRFVLRRDTEGSLTGGKK